MMTQRAKDRLLTGLVAFAILANLAAAIYRDFNPRQ